MPSLAVACAAASRLQPSAKAAEESPAGKQFGQRGGRDQVLQVSACLPACCLVCVLCIA